MSRGRIRVVLSDRGSWNAAPPPPSTPIRNQSPLRPEAAMQRRVVAEVRTMEPPPWNRRESLPEEEEEEPIFPNGVPDELACAICLRVARDAVVTEQCGHLYCRSCLHRLLSHGRGGGATSPHVKMECAVCRQPLRMEEIRNDLRAQRSIMSLMVQCPRTPDGCRWEGELRGWKSHQESCLFAERGCPMGDLGCDFSASSKGVEEHLKKETESHLLLLARAVVKLREENLVLRQTVEAVRAAGVVVPTDGGSALPTTTALRPTHSEESFWVGSDIRTAGAVPQPRSSAVDAYALNAHLHSSVNVAPATPRPSPHYFWIITNVSERRGPLYSDPFSMNGRSWYLGVDIESPLGSGAGTTGGSDSGGPAVGVYLFADGHLLRVDYTLTMFNADPSRNRVHAVHDWAEEYRGKGWGPVNFLELGALDRLGFVVEGCLRLAVTLDASPYE